MTQIVIISKLGQCVNKKVKNLNIDTLYKYCNLKKSTKHFTIRQTWKVGNVFISVYAKDNGRSGSENKYELPPPVDSDLYFGNLVIISHSEEEVNNENVIDLSLKEWEKIYEKLMGGYESLNDEDSYSDD